jgi:hypothetical protein
MELPLTKSTAVCPMLRTKTAYGTYDVPWQEGASTTAVYWCLETMATAGPDEQLAHPHECREGRGCFRKEEI